MIQDALSCNAVGVEHVTKIMPSLKARPEWIPWALMCIRDNMRDHKKMHDCITAHWRKVSQRTKAPLDRNALRGVFGPTLRHLQLIMGEGDKIELTPEGKNLLETHQKQGGSAFKRALAKHLVNLETIQWIPVILQLQKADEPIQERKLLDSLSSTYGTCVSSDKLSKILLYYSYVGLVNREGGAATLRKKQLNALLKGVEVTLSKNEFVRALITAYKKLSSAAHGSRYVPIPKLREAVLERTGIWPEDFYKMLQEIPKESTNYLIHLSQPMMRKPGGIKIGEKYLYYAAIYKKGGKVDE